MNYYFISPKLQDAIEAAAKLEAENAYLQSLGIEPALKNRLPSYPLPKAGPETSSTDTLLRGILYGGENIGGEWFEYSALSSGFSLNVPPRTRYAVIYPEHTEAETVRVAYINHNIDGYASQADQPRMPVYGRKAIRISGGKNLTSCQIVPEPGVRLNVFYYA